MESKIEKLKGKYYIYPKNSKDEVVEYLNALCEKQNEIIDHLNSQAQPEENEEWEKRFIRTFGYWGEEIKFIKQLLKEREREVLEDIKRVNNEIYEGRTEILEVEIDNRLDKLNKEEK